jgi:hypothetical protein
VAAITALAAVPRLLGCASEFWLDEAWTWNDLQRLHGALGIFTAIHHSNNHHLASLWMYAVGDGPEWAHRVLALATGTCSVPLAAWLAGRRDALAGALAALLVGSSYLLVSFSSEARGYAPVVFFSLAAWAALEAELRSRRGAPAAVFAGSLVLAFLSQLIALFFWAGAFVWSTPRILRDGAPRAALLRLARLHGPPALALAALYAVDLRHLVVGRGPAFAPRALVASLVEFGLGLPLPDAAALPAAALAVLALGAALLRLRHLGDDRWRLHLVVIVLAPAAVLGALRPEVIAARYFVISVAFALIVWSEPLAAWLRAGGRRRALAAGLLAAFAVGNGVETARFLAGGRGHYREALLTMAAETAGPRIEVASNQDFRVQTLLRYYARALPPGKRLDYRARGRRPAAGADWLVVPIPRDAGPAAPTLTDPRGHGYRLVGDYGFEGLAGSRWTLYRKRAAGASQPPPPLP